MTGRAGWSPAILGTAQSEVGHVAATTGTKAVGGVGSAEGGLIALSPDHDGDFYGYVERGTPAERAILQALRRNRRQRMMLRIRRAPGVAPEGSPQVEILALEGLGWTRANAVEPAPVWGGG